MVAIWAEAKWFIAIHLNWLTCQLIKLRPPQMLIDEGQQSQASISKNLNNIPKSMYDRLYFCKEIGLV
jgi:hypothetical protein